MKSLKVVLKFNMSVRDPVDIKAGCWLVEECERLTGTYPLTFSTCTIEDVLVGVFRAMQIGCPSTKNILTLSIVSGWSDSYKYGPLAWRAEGR